MAHRLGADGVINGLLPARSSVLHRLSTASASPRAAPYTWLNPPAPGRVTCRSPASPAQFCSHHPYSWTSQSGSADPALPPFSAKGCRSSVVNR